MNTENSQALILKSVKELAAISDDSIINVSALCRMLSKMQIMCGSVCFRRAAALLKQLHTTVLKNNNKQQS